MDEQKDPLDSALRTERTELQANFAIVAGYGIYLLARAAWRQCVRNDGDRR